MAYVLLNGRRVEVILRNATKHHYQAIQLQINRDPTKQIRNMKMNIIKQALWLSAAALAIGQSVLALPVNFTVLPNPFTNTTGNIAWSISGTNIVGNFTDSTGNHGYFYSGGVYVTLNDPLATSAGTSPRGVSGNQVIGQYYAGANTVTACGFL